MDTERIPKSPTSDITIRSVLISTRSVPAGIPLNVAIVPIIPIANAVAAPIFI
jgi:hypothetical protein